LTFDLRKEFADLYLSDVGKIDSFPNPNAADCFSEGLMTDIAYEPYGMVVAFHK
jgi:hypothetical protein